MRLFVGLSGFGKTYRSEKEIKKFQKAHPEHNILTITPYPEDFKSAGSHAKNIGQALEFIDEKKGRGVIAPVSFQNEIAQADKVGEILFQKKKPVLLIWDEVQRIKVGTADVPPNFAFLIDEGRHLDIHVWCIGRRPRQVPILLRSQAHEVFAFHVNSKRDIVELEDFFGDHAKLARKLPKYWYLYHNEHTGTNLLLNDKGKVVKQLT